MRPEAEKEKVVELRKAGMTYQKIAKTLGYKTASWVEKVCQENDLGGHYGKKLRDDEYRRYKAQGHTNAEVAEHFGINYRRAKNICKGIAPQPPSGNNQYKKNTEEDNRAYVESLLPMGFSYVGGYIDCEHKITIRCKVCGLEFERSMDSIRHGRNTICPVCAENEKRAKAEEKEREAE